jgi:hypothetical protein
VRWLPRAALRDAHGPRVFATAHSRLPYAHSGPVNERGALLLWVIDTALLVLCAIGYFRSHATYKWGTNLVPLEPEDVEVRRSRGIYSDIAARSARRSGRVSSGGNEERVSLRCERLNSRRHSQCPSSCRALMLQPRRCRESWYQELCRES